MLGKVNDTRGKLIERKIILIPFQNERRLKFLHILRNALIKRKRNVILPNYPN